MSRLTTKLYFNSYDFTESEEEFEIELFSDDVSPARLDSDEIKQDKRRSSSDGPKSEGNKRSPEKSSKKKRPSTPDISSDEEWLIEKETKALSLSVDSINEPSLGPPHPEDLTDVIKLKTTKIFRVIKIYSDGLLSLRNHADLKEYLLMDGILQKFYKEHEGKLKGFITNENLTVKGYYVAKLGFRFERCQFIKHVPPKENTGFDLRIRLLDYGVPMVVPISVLLPMHLGFKSLRAQGLTAQLLDDDYKRVTVSNQTDEDDPRIPIAYQDDVYETAVYKVDRKYPECPHILCKFLSQIS